MNIQTVSDLELAKVLADQQQLFFQTSKNLELLQVELNKRLEAAKEAKPE